MTFVLLASACGRFSISRKLSGFKLWHDEAKKVFKTQLRQWKSWSRPVAQQTSSHSLHQLLRPASGIGFVITSYGFASFWKHTHAFCCPEPALSRLVKKDLFLPKEHPFDWGKLLELLTPDKWLLVLAIACATVVAFINIQIPLLIGEIANIVSEYAGKSHLTAFTTAMSAPTIKIITVYCMQAFFTTFYIGLLSIIGENIAHRLKAELFSTFLKQDIHFFEKHKTGELINRLTTDIQDFKSSFKSCVSQGLRNVLQTAGCFVSLYIISPRMTLLVVIVLPTIILVGSVMGTVLRKLSRKAHYQVERSIGVADEAIGNIRTVRAFAMENKEYCLFSAELTEASRLNKELGIGIGIFQGLSNLALNGIVLGVIYIGGCLVQDEKLTRGSLTSFLIAAQTIQRSLAQLSLLFGHFVKGVTAGNRVFEYLKSKPTMPLRGGETIPYHSLRCNVEFQNVTFSYPMRPEQVVLKNFNLTVPPGRMVALCGVSGGGKSTVAALLERFYDVNEGCITLDGRDIRHLDPSWLRGQVIGFISQEPVLFATTIMENIRYGRPSATNDEVKEAAKLANAADFISTFPNGYDTVLGERGVTVSGGQKQRIAIARAFLKNPSILILDEATSALDAESEKIVQEALDKIVKGRTVLVIAHRLSTIQKADLIVVLSGGVVTEMGTHEQLKSLKGRYWDLIRQQEMLTGEPVRFAMDDTSKNSDKKTDKNFKFWSRGS